MLLFKSSMEKSGYKLRPMSEIKNINIIEYGMSDNMNNINNIYENELNQNEFTKKNLTELFNNAKNDEFLQSTKKRINLDNNNNNTNYYSINNNNFLIPNDNNNNINNNNTFMNNIPNNNCQISLEYLKEENKENKNPNNNSINNNNNINNIPNIIYNNNNSHPSDINLSNNKNEEMFDSPLNKKPKKIFECSGSTFATNSSKSSSRKRRFRKNNEQLLMLSQFFNEHKHWSKNQIKEISQKAGLKENNNNSKHRNFILKNNKITINIFVYQISLIKKYNKFIILQIII